MQNNTNAVLTQKQQRLLAGLAEGLSQRDAARQAGLHPVSACIIAKRPDFREELLRIREDAEARLVARLPALVDQALDILTLELKLPTDRRLRAVKLVLDLAERVCRQPAVTEPTADLPVLEVIDAGKH